MSITRERLSPQESRAAALEAARRLLIDKGPQAVTLKAVAAEIGKTHANLLHHFGSAAGLQSALAGLISDRVCAGIEEAVVRARAREADPIEIVDRTFDAFGREGAGALAAWMILSGNRDALNPVLDAIHELVDHLRAGHEDRPVQETTLWLVLVAMGDSLLGAEMAEALGLGPGKAREVARRALLAMTALGARERMITGVHAMIFSKDEAADRAFLRDMIGLDGIDSGGGWLIFKLPPTGELGVHGGENGFHQIYFICDNVDDFVADLAGKGVTCEEIETAPWGRITYVPLPGGGRLGVYEATHARP